ncbi:methyltransferase domain-containing protein [Candidatus Poribacteria bacterium]|nr:methyltransferase domain-containing protein [Candidatus Poribacteria bacterium]
MDIWNPGQYERFKRERAQPFHDLLAMVRPRSGMRVVDLGCGTGELTAQLHETLGAAGTLGLDNSPAMLEKAAPFRKPGLSFQLADIGEFATRGEYDLVFSNAALQWLDDHKALFARVADALAPGGQLAVQMPANHDHVSHTTAREIASEEPFRSLLGGHVRESPVLPVEEYAGLLDSLAFGEQEVLLRVYAHHLPGPEDVIEWVKGTLLTDYAKRLAPEDFARFLEAYRARLLGRLPPDRPCLFLFKRILLWGQR